MALRSMTGFGSAEGQDEELKVVCEARSVNARYLDVVVRGAPDLATEDTIRKIVGSRVSRGRVELALSLEWLNASSKQVKVDKLLALAYYNNLKELQEDLGIAGSIEISHVSLLPGVVTAVDRAPEGHRQLILDVVSRCLDRLIQMKEREGESLAREIRLNLSRIGALVDRIEALAPGLVERYRQRLASRAVELCGNGIDPSRLVQETVIVAERCNIAEEVARLKSHVAQAEECVCPGEGWEFEPVGKKLEFITQEMHREANTIGSKAGDAEIGAMVVELKCSIENIREQVQNVE
ncbi:MAG: YicC/YloC family endoribonuclease [Bacillota bacterium]